MALKSKITKAEHEALNDVLKAEYTVDATGAHYLLQTDDLTELRAAKDREAEARRLAEAALATANAETARKTKEANDAAAAAAEAAARASGDINALETSWKAKLDGAVAEGQSTITRLTTQLTKVLVDKTAEAIAAKISVAPTLLAPVIRARLTTDLTGDEPITRVLGADGKPSALSIDDLEKELVANNEFAAIIRASDASGGGAHGQHRGGGASKKISDMTEAERVAAHSANPTLYKQQAKAEGLTVYG